MAAVPGLLRRWNPGIIPGLRSWYDGSDSASMTFSSGCNISQLNDKSGYRTHHLTQGTQSNQPKFNTTINGLPSINFTGSNVFMSTISANFPNSINSNSLTHFMILRPLSNYTFPATNTNLYVFNNSNNSVNTGLTFQNNSLTYINTGQANKVVTTNATPYTILTQTYINKLNSNFIVATMSNNNSGNLSGLYSGLNSYKIGSINNTAQFTGSFGEIIVYSNYYYDYNEHLLLEGYLSWKWGIVSQLSNGHPYKLRPPT